MAGEYDPEWLEWEKAVGRPTLPEDPHARREAFNSALIALSKNLPQTDPGIETRDEQISPQVKIRIYRPAGSKGRTLPLVVFCHGGGWQAGNVDTEDHMCRTVCERVGCIVVSVDYRLVLEVAFPTPIDDCFTAYQYAYDHADALGADRKRYSIWGGSAGASLAISVAYRLVSRGYGDRISGLIVMAGMFVHPDAVPPKYKHLHVSYVENGGDVPIVTAERMLEAYELFIGHSEIKNVDWFPVTGAPESLKGFPRTYITNTDKEAMRDDGKVLEAALKDAGVSVRRNNMPALPHYFWCFPIEKASARFRDTLVEGIKWVVDPS